MDTLNMCMVFGTKISSVPSCCFRRDAIRLCNKKYFSITVCLSHYLFPETNVSIGNFRIEAWHGIIMNHDDSMIHGWSQCTEPSEKQTCVELMMFSHGLNYSTSFELMVQSKSMTEFHKLHVLKHTPCFTIWNSTQLCKYITENYVK